MSEYLFTSESVSEGHPDKVADRISDALVDLHLSRDSDARIAIETMVTTNRVILAGEVRCQNQPTPYEVEYAVRQVIKAIGYEQSGFHWADVQVQNYIHEQSADIAMGVDSSENKEVGAGDQGIMFGYACDETPALMPAPIFYSHGILKKLTELRHANDESPLEPDAKSQVTLRYKDGRPVGAESIVVSTQHKEGFSQSQLREIVRGVVESVLPEGWMCPDENFYVNPTGNFVIGGPDGDAGLTGRKIIVDTYGGAAPHGGGAFSGKDSTKVDRSAAYMARYLAKNVVAAGLASGCLIQLSYAIGVSKPLSVYVGLEGDVKVDASELEKVLPELVDLSPQGIRTHLDLLKPIYERTSAYGHFGRDPEEDGGFSWEKCDLVPKLTDIFKANLA